MTAAVLGVIRFDVEFEGSKGQSDRIPIYDMRLLYFRCNHNSATTVIQSRDQFGIGHSIHQVG